MLHLCGQETAGPFPNSGDQGEPDGMWNAIAGANCDHAIMTHVGRGTWGANIE